MCPHATTKYYYCRLDARFFAEDFGLAVMVACVRVVGTPLCSWIFRSSLYLLYWYKNTNTDANLPVDGSLASAWASRVGETAVLLYWLLTCVTSC